MKSQNRQLHAREMGVGMMGSSRNPTRCKEELLPSRPSGFTPVTPREAQTLGDSRIWTFDVTPVNCAPQLCQEQQGDHASPIAPLLASCARRQDAEWQSTSAATKSVSSKGQISIGNAKRERARLRHGSCKCAFKDVNLHRITVRICTNSPRVM